MKAAGHFFVVALLLGGCSNLTSEANSHNGEQVDEAVSLASLEVRHAAVLAQCNEIAIERNILISQYNALIIAYNIGIRPAKSIMRECSQSRSSAKAGTSETLAPKIQGAGDRKAIAKVEVEPPALCWEGYCPCEPPQGGPDQLLCDALRRGDADPKMLSVGKSMRETRRQISEYQL